MNLKEGGRQMLHTPIAPWDPALIFSVGAEMMGLFALIGPQGAWQCTPIQGAGGLL